MSVIRTFLLGRFSSTLKFIPYFGGYITLKFSRSNVRYYISSIDSIQPSQQMTNILQKKFPKARKIIVNDMSGGCGSMFEIFVETVEFQGLSLVKQHMLINETLKDHIKNMHGLTVRTKVPDADAS